MNDYFLRLYIDERQRQLANEIRAGRGPEVDLIKTKRSWRRALAAKLALPFFGRLAVSALTAGRGGQS